MGVVWEAGARLVASVGWLAAAACSMAGGVAEDPLRPGVGGPAEDGDAWAGVAEGDEPLGC